MAVPALITGGLAAVPALLEKFFPGKKEKFQQQQAFGPEQMNLYRQQMSQIGDPMNKGFDYLNQQLQGYEPGKSPIEQMAQQQFQQQTVPELSEQFAGMGAGSSSGFGQQMGAAAGDLQTRMAGMRQQQQQSAQQMMMQMLGQIQGQQPYATQYIPAQGGAGSAVAPGMGQGLGMMMPEILRQLEQNQTKTPPIVGAPSGQWQQGTYGSQNDDVYRRVGGY